LIEKLLAIRDTYEFFQAFNQGPEKGVDGGTQEK